MTTFVRRDASDDEVLNLVRNWIDALARAEYESVAHALGYALAFGRPEHECIREAIRGYRSTTYYPGIDRFVVTDWRTACGGNESRKQEVVRYKPNSTRLVGAVAFDFRSTAYGVTSRLTLCSLRVRIQCKASRSGSKKSVQVNRKRKLQPNPFMNLTRDGMPRMSITSFWPKRVTPLRAGYRERWASHRSAHGH